MKLTREFGGEPGVSMLKDKVFVSDGDKPEQGASGWMVKGTTDPKAKSQPMVSDRKSKDAMFSMSRS